MKTYEAIVKGENLPESGIPESFKVLLKELQALGLDVQVLDENQNEVKIGDYPYVDAFVSAKWKRMRILFKYQHLNKGLFGNGEAFQVARYPLNPGMFKLGISWAFYD